VPAKTPNAVVNKLNADLVRIPRVPDMRVHLESLGFDVLGTTPEEFAALPGRTSPSGRES